MEQPQAMPMDGASPVPNQDPMMGGDQAMGGEEPMGDDPAMGGEAPMMGGDDPAMSGEGDDSTTSIINQLSPEDKEAVRAYAESMLNKTEDQAGGNEEPMMESVIFTKKQLKAINESFRDSEETRDDKTKLNKKKSQTVSNKSPFNSPKFN